MKTLILLRHAKSELPSLSQSDFERKLSDKGKIDIIKVSAAFNLLNIQPDIILCSSAARTRETLTSFIKVTNIKSAVKFLEPLYHASASEILNTILAFSDQYSSIMVVGHNFGISTLADRLSNKGAEQMSTSAIHVLQFDQHIEPYQGQLIHSLSHKSL